ncbi:cupredoxin domain-containing protein [Ciceribacter ferrooxidans]|nr:cupredoxin domain-containing protein [Ciceribacter ferrooxidans]
MTATLIRRRSLLLAGPMLLTVQAVAKAHDGTVHVAVEKLAFTPAEIEVGVGETIEWTNRDPFAHTATVKGGWEVLIPPGKSATHVVAPGDTVDYFCRWHPNMKGRIKVIA